MKIESRKSLRGIQRAVALLTGLIGAKFLAGYEDGPMLRVATKQEL